MPIWSEEWGPLRSALYSGVKDRRFLFFVTVNHLSYPILWPRLVSTKLGQDHPAGVRLGARNDSSRAA